MIREDVYKLIDGERDYQDWRWNENTTISKNLHSFEEWFMYIEDYVNEAKHLLSRLARQDADVQASEIMRKVAAMAICALEEHGAPSRVFNKE